MSAFRSRRVIAQPTPSATPEDVERIVRRDFSSEQFEEVMTIIGEYKQSKWAREYPRVQLAALKLAQGNVEALRRAIKTATQDYRDVLAPAEYPEFTRAGMFEVRRLPVREQQRIIASDWKQYTEWLTK